MTEKQILKAIEPLSDRFDIIINTDGSFVLKAKFGDLEVEYEDMKSETKKDLYNRLLSLQFSQGYRVGLEVGKSI